MAVPLLNLIFFPPIAFRYRESRTVCRTRAVIAAGSFLPNKSRLACTLLELAGDFGQDVGGRTVIRQRIGQSDLAAMTGIGRESANRIINDWQRRQIISRSSGYYWIENKDQLQQNYRPTNASPRLVLEIDIGKLLAVVVAHRSHYCIRSYL
jgi:CRP-like cAMP-binding protein